eukprot:s218_g30.t1
MSWQGLAKHTVKKRQSTLVQEGEPPPKKAEPEVCEDDNKNMVWNHLPGCKSFASMGYCHRFSPLARKYCRLSCALCTVGSASEAQLVGEKDLQESSSASVQVAGSGMSLSGARRGSQGENSQPRRVLTLRPLRQDRVCHTVTCSALDVLAQLCGVLQSLVEELMPSTEESGSAANSVSAKAGKASKVKNKNPAPVQVTVDDLIRSSAGPSVSSCSRPSQLTKGSGDGQGGSKELWVGMFSLPEACSKGCEEQVAWWLARLEKKPCHFRLQPAERSPLHAASMHGHAGCVALLLECGSFKVDETDQGGATAMAYACENGYLDVVQILSSYGARRTHLRDAMGGYFAFEAAAGHSHIVQWLAKTRDWCTPLHHASVLPVARVISLLRAGARLHHRKRDPTKLCVSPLELARENTEGSEASQASQACRLVVLASQPWCAWNHHLFPDPLRRLAKWLALLGHHLSQRYGRQLADIWRMTIIPMVVDRQQLRMQARGCVELVMQQRPAVFSTKLARRPMQVALAVATLHVLTSASGCFLSCAALFSPNSWRRNAGSSGPRFLRAVSSLQEPLPLDEEIELWTIQFLICTWPFVQELMVQHYDWVNAKSYSTDGTIPEEEHDEVWRVSKARLQYWPRLYERHIHQASVAVSEFGSQATQRFSNASDAVQLGDPMNNIFIINLPRRPAKLKHVISQLHQAGLNAFVGNLVTRRKGSAAKVENNIPAALILEDDFDLQENFKERLGAYLEEARGLDWNLMYLGRSPTEGDIRRVTEHLAQPGYTLWTVGYIFKLDAAKALVEADDHYFSVAMGQGFRGHWNENAVEWSKYIPQVLRGLAITPPLVMPYVGSMFLSDTAMLRNGTKFVTDLPVREGDSWTAGRKNEEEWRAAQGVKDP